MNETSPQKSANTNPPGNSSKIGVYLVNLGTPDATDYWSMRRYLKEFLSDHRVIELNRLLWWFILNVIVLTKRPSASGKAYQSIWNKERNESPLRTTSRSQAEKVAAQLSGHPEIIVEWGMRYGTPSTKSGLDKLAGQGCDRILMFPLYPQYAAATSATACDKAFDALKQMRCQPSLRVVPPYYEHPDYISALATSIKDHLSPLDWEPEVVIASFHGLPKAYIDKGDPYQSHCDRTTQLMRDALGWDENKLRLTFQSRFGKAEWIPPYTDKTVEALAKEGVKNLAVVTPGFSADCVETLEEIAIENGDIFKENGGENFTLIPCLNDSTASIQMLTNIIRNELQGWLKS